LILETERLKTEVEALTGQRVQPLKRGRPRKAVVKNLL
jgi:hypothetical protein